MRDLRMSIFGSGVKRECPLDKNQHGRRWSEDIRCTVVMTLLAALSSFNMSIAKPKSPVIPGHLGNQFSPIENLLKSAQPCSVNHSGTAYWGSVAGIHIQTFTSLAFTGHIEACRW